MAIRRIGRWDLQEQPSSGKVREDGNGRHVTLIYSGLLEDCHAARPARGSVVEGYAGFYVDSSNVDPQPAGRGTLTIEISASPSSVTIPAGADDTEIKYGVTWQREERPMILHSRYAYEPTPGTDSLNWDDRSALKNWEECPDVDLKKVFKYYTDNANRTPEGGTTLSANAQKYAKKRLKGQESYAVYHPVAKKTTVSRVALSPTACGTTGTPTGFGSMLPTQTGGGAFVWLKDGDDVNRTGEKGKYERVETWLGAEEWDEDFYPAAPALPGDAKKEEPPPAETKEQPGDK